MGTRKIRSWAVDRPVSSPFALPSGRLGHLAGRFMLWTNRREQDEILGALSIAPGDRVLEVGYGPGGLVRRLVDRTDAALVRGVDPSPEMRDLATRVNRRAARSGRVALEVGAADRTGLPGQSMDQVVTVNTVAIWPDLEAGLRELHRVVRPGGTVLIAWHGGTAPAKLGERLRLPDDKLDQIEAGLRDLFAKVTRDQLDSLDIFRAVR